MSLYPDNKNPFATSSSEGFIDDEAFLRGGASHRRTVQQPQRPQAPTANRRKELLRDSTNQRRDYNYGSDAGANERRGYDFGEEPVIDRQQQLQQLKQQSMNRQLDSTQRCLASIYDSEAVGVATAEELVRQGEQLDNIEMKVEKINADTRQSQRHLDGIKSIFGGLKNWWQGADNVKKDSFTTPPRRSETLRDTIDVSNSRTASSNSSSSAHPALQIRSGNTAGFYDDDDESSRENKQQQRSAEWQAYETGLNKNLDMMSDGLSQLKLLARGLGDEIESQNDQLDRIAPKVDRADTRIRDQNRQMRQILGKDTKK